MKTLGDKDASRRNSEPRGRSFTQSCRRWNGRSITTTVTTDEKGDGENYGGILCRCNQDEPYPLLPNAQIHTRVLTDDMI